MGRRRWFNDLARDYRDIRTLQRATSHMDDRTRKGCGTMVAVAFWIFVVLVIIGVFWIGSSGKKKSIEPAQVTATFEQRVRNNLMPLNVTYVPTATAGESSDDEPTATPIPTPTIDPVLLIRYEEERTDPQGNVYIQCLIKGNINSKGSKIYHVPGTSSYKSTKIDTSQGERWFCTEAEAIAAGWHAPGQ